LIAVPQSKLTLGKILKSLRFWHMLAMQLCSIFFGLYLASVWKPIASKEGVISETILTRTAVYASLANGLARFFWGYMTDILGFHLVVLINMTAQTIISATLFSFRTNPDLYPYMVFAAFFFYAGAFTTFPPTVIKVFGSEKGPQVASIVHWSVAIASITGFFINLYLKGKSEQVFFVATGLSLLNILLVLMFDTSQVKLDEKGAIMP